jgi:hypothetical protein
VADRRYPPVGLVLVTVVAAAIVILYFTTGLSGSGETVPDAGLAAGADREPARLDGGWDRIDLPGTARLTDVWDVDGRLYAAGRHPQLDAAVVWRSDDGRDWVEVKDADGSFSGATLHEVTAFDGALVALGTRQVGEAGSERVVPAVWRGAGDGRLFLVPDAVATPDGLPPAGGGFFDSAQLDGRLYAVGWTGVSSSATDSAGAVGTVWVSADGESFEEVTLARGVFETPATVIRRVIATSDGLVAVGESGGALAVWTSGSGTTWTEQARGAAGTPGDHWSGEAAVVGPTGTLAFGERVPEVGEAADQRLFTWSSSGEEGWAPLAADVFGGAVPVGMDGDALGYVAAGNVAIGDGRTTGALWVSADALTWNRVLVEDMVPGASSVSDVALFDGGVAVVGETYQQPAIWFRQAGVISAEQPVTAAGPLAPPTWAAVFQEKDPSGASPVTILRAGGRLYGFAPERVVWTSDDGVEWRPARFDEVGLASAEAITSLTFEEGLYLAVGEEEGTGLWVSRDGLTWGRPSKAPPCCVRAVVAEGAGMAAFIEGGDGWMLARSPDGFQWEVDDQAHPFPVDLLWQSASLGQTWMVWGSARDSEENELWVSVSDGGWVETRGPDGAFTNMSWEGVWEFDGQVVVAGKVGERTVMYSTTDGLTWEAIRVPGADRAPDIRDVATIPGGLAVAIVVDGRLLGVATITDGAETDIVGLTPDDGFGGLRAALIPGTDALRTVGPDHGRMTVWEWIP